MEMTLTAVDARRALPTGSAHSRRKSRVASVLCVLPALYFLATVCFALANWQDYLSATPQLIRYVIAPGAIFAALALCALFGSRYLRVTLGGTILGILIALFVFEAYLQATGFRAIMGLVTVPQREWMDKAGARGLPPAFTINRLNQSLGVRRLDHAVLSGLPGQRTLLCVHKGKPIFYQADHLGFRNAEAVYAKPVNLMVVGDSFVEGLCLPEGRDLVARIGETQGNVMNLGTRGAGPLLELAMLGRFGAAIKPKRVIIAFYEGNDWDNLENERRVPFLMRALAPDAKFGPARLAPAVAHRSEGIVQEWIRRDTPGLVEMFQRTNVVRNTFALHATGTQLGIGYPRATPEIADYARILARAKALAAGWGGTLELMYIPQSSRFQGIFTNQFVYDQLREKVLRDAKANGVPVIDLVPPFLAQPDKHELFAPDGHLSERGASLAARLVAGRSAAK